MRSRSSTMNNNRSMEVGRPKHREEPQLSGAYIRSLVKHLSSSRPRDSTAPKSSDSAIGDHHLPRDPTKPTEGLDESEQPQPPPPPQQPKKQVRRRLHTSRPYQERLLNMAEARREIVTALKLHRASMKQANEQQQQSPIPPPPMEDSHQEMRPNPNLHHPSSTLPNNYYQNPCFSPFTYPPLCWPYPPIAPLPISDNLNLSLPNQPLGLNLNFQGFNNIDTPFNTKPTIQPLSSSSSSLYSYSSPPTMSASPPASNEPRDSMLHPVMDDEEMAEIRSIGEQHDMEWNDTMNLVTSAWWSKFLKTMEVGPEERGRDGFRVFNEVPAWLSDDGSGGDSSSSCLDDHRDMEDYLQVAALPCMDIGEIEGLDGDWLS